MKTLLRTAAVLSLIAAAPLSLAQPPNRPPPPPPSLISYDQAATAMTAAEAEALANEWPLTILIVDQNNNPVMMHRMEGASPFTFNIAQRKTLTVIESGGMTSAEYGMKVEAGEIDEIENAVTFGGGVPIYLDGELIGAIAASGARPEEDEAASAAGVEAIGGSTSM